jgi:hypothetical protein
VRLEIQDPRSDPPELLFMGNPLLTPLGEKVKSENLLRKKHG